MVGKWFWVRLLQLGFHDRLGLFLLCLGFVMVGKWERLLPQDYGISEV